MDDEEDEENIDDEDSFVESDLNACKSKGKGKGIESES